jgi:raffinose/stachyose/melibiose transport system permease protein
MGTHRARPMNLPSDSSFQVAWRKRHCYLYLIPIFVLLGTFSYYPPITALYYSLFDFNGNQLSWVGLGNFINLTQDATFQTAVRNVLLLMIAALLTSLVPSLTVAELLFALRSKRMSNFFRTMFLIPTLVPALAVILTWRYIYNQQYGLINVLLATVHLGNLQHDWLGSFDTALLSLMFFNFPWVNGTTMLILLAALLNIPGEVIDSYRLDGSGILQRLWSIDIPLIAGAIRLVLTLSIIESLQGLTLQFTLTGGGPGDATMVPAYYMYRDAFYDSQFGYASAIGVVLFLVILATTILSRRFIRFELEHQPR